ncbi:MAG: carboxypeptidase-like regulatory domain-containing protein [Prevotella sp.]|nr:carboxypeptidase-like regulatory domain-containing protein [Prevotella sp.]
MKQMKKSIKVLSILIFFWTLVLTAAAQSLHGFVVDQQTGDSIPYANAAYKGSASVAAGNESGKFVIVRQNGQTLTISAVGYKPRRVKISENTPEELRVSLIPDSKRMEEVVVKAKRRHKYTRKNNPAVDLMRRVIAAKKRTNLENHDYYQYNKYQKITMAVNNLTPEELEGSMFKKHPWLLNQVEVCPYNQKLILPISVDETLTQHIYRKNPRDSKDIILGQTTNGISKLIQTGEALNTVAKDVFSDIDIYDDQIRLLQKQFPSPIGSTAISFYHFYIDDTVYVDQDPCIRLQFMPANQQDFGFRGELYVLNDSSLHVKKCDMQLPAGTGVNFVDAMKIEQAYSKLPNGEWALMTDNMVAELEVTELVQRAIVIRTTNMNQYSFEEIPDREFKGKAKTRYDVNAKMRNNDFWNEHRTVELTKSEAGMDDFIQSMSKAKNFKWFMFVSKALIENFVETGTEKTPSKFDIGPVNTIVSKNFVDGMRFRLSGRTTAKLNPHWFGEGYYAYGADSKKHYYGTTLTYSFNKPEYQPHEFPVRTISLESSYDLMSPSDKFLIHNKDNIFMAFRPKKVEQMYFYNRQRLEFKWETDYGLTSSLELKTESNEPTGMLEFRRLADGELVRKIRTTEVTLGFDYRPGQTYINTKQQRFEVNLDAPQFTLSHTMGLNHFLGGQFRYNYTELSAYKRLWLGSWGHIDWRLKAGAQWNKVPFPLLIMPPVNTSYFEHQGSFNMMENMEFLNDRFAQFNVAWDLSGKLFNRIPLLKKLKWREYVAFKGMWGHLTDKNNPFLAGNTDDADLYRFPENTHVMNNEPYLELVVGVHNIFKCLEVDYVRRLTYTAYPGTDVNGIRFGFNIVF